MANRDDASVVKALEVVAALVARQNFLPLRQQIGYRLAAMTSSRNTQTHFLESHARSNELRRKIKDLTEASVYDLQPCLAIVEAEALRHV
ncbi:hypothetical protein BwSH20_21210 [Bradyrhizobium ottawaense]|nr:hypothetical protein SG09_78730 [Bradyrhizobium ottawaense]GMO23354.1 hypothetical protein BwSF12_16840 [Bradyrhizobium ottawaense]GMO23720.1 hypothetical protein BwSF21_20100 [Bradyrhizobium ottawaense]GMO38159.1 hypothetical protein BwSH14_46610 [Bradyrhizobium ottawaense]GMO66717.1 hypothetical protein BwSH17_19160 [Bradyrhizobium ottawaense]